MFGLAHIDTHLRQYQLVIYGGLSGRLDQTAHTLHTLYKLRKERQWTWVVSEESLTCVLEAVGLNSLSSLFFS